MANGREAGPGGRSADAQVDAEQVAARAEMTQRRLVALDRHLALLEQDLAELQQALATLQGLEGRPPGAGLVPIGGGVRLHALIDPGADVLLDLGAGYSAATDVAGALDRVKARLEATQAAYRAADHDAARLSAEFNDQRERLAALASSGSAAVV